MDEHVEREMVALLPRLRRFALALTASEAEADDLVQATCERAIANLDKWRTGSRLDSWMYRIAQNLHLNGRRDAALRARKLAAHAETAPRAHDGEAAATARAGMRELAGLMALLPQEQRVALLLVGAEGRSYAETAEITGASVAAVTSRVARARAALRAAMEAGA